MEFNIPKSWEDISTEFWKELVLLKPEDFISTYEYKIELFYALLNDDIDIDELEIDEVIEILESIDWVFKEPSTEHKKKIGGFRLKDVNSLSLGEFIDLEHYAKDGYINKIEYICSILYKKYKTDEWDNEIEEPYIYDLEKRKEIFLKTNISNIYGVLKYYIDWKTKFMKIFDSLFQDPDFDVIEDEDKLSEEEVIEIKKEIEKEKIKASFSWHFLIYKLCNGDITKMDAITNLSVNYIFTTLSMKKTLEL